MFGKLKKDNERLEKKLTELTVERDGLLEKNASLINENAKLKEKLDKFCDGCELKNDLEKEEKAAFKRLASADKRAEEIKDEARARYVLEIKRLKLFVSKWENYLTREQALSQNKAAKDKASKLVCALKLLLIGDEDAYNLDDAAKKTEELKKGIESLRAGENKKSSDSAVIDYFAENSFDLDEVLNPSEDLDLEKLCKELGVMD